MTPEKPIAIEAGHWYHAIGTPNAGQPCYEVPCKSRPGQMRPTTLRDARVLDLVPSTTTIIRCAAAPGLIRYFERQIWEATVTTGRYPDESDEAYWERCRAWAKEHSELARDKGAAIHGAIERRIMLQSVEPEMFAWTEAAVAALNTIAVDVSAIAMARAEHSFASGLGYGGKIDLSAPGLVVDFKTKPDWQPRDRLAWDEHGMQLVAYAQGLGQSKSRLCNVFISTEQPGKYAVHEWPQEEHERLWEMFLSLLRYWQAANRFGGAE